MNTYEEWKAAHPDAAIDLEHMLDALPWPTGPEEGYGRSEAWAQQQARFRIREQGALSWRNNVGATPSKTAHTCPYCYKKFQEKQQPVRYGLANDNMDLNKNMKSSDLILLIPRLITPDMVGTTIGQFGGVETKPAGWQYTGEGREAGQTAWGVQLVRHGGFFKFSTGDIQL